MPRTRGRDAVLLVLAFAGGITSLGLEIAASRLLAPFFGASTLIWGALIGLILLYLSVGYYIGGRVADRWPAQRTLYGLTAVASLVVLLIPLMSRPVLLFSQHALVESQFGALVGALVAVILIFAPSVILLGMVSPYVIRLRVSTLDVVGRAAGAVYAVSTAGSILGAFLPAFWWIPSYGTRATIYGLGIVLLAVSVVGLVASGDRRSALTSVVLMIAVMSAAALVHGPVRLASEETLSPTRRGILLYDGESEYGYIQVVRHGDETDLILNEGQMLQSVYNPRKPLTGAEWDYFSLAPLFANRTYAGQKPSRVLIIGLAGGTIARQLTASYGDIPIDGVEIDPRIIDVGRRYFDMNEPRLNAITADGRYFIASSQDTYDLILVDAYRWPYIPFQFTTREFFEECRRHLSATGVLAINVERGPGDYRLVDAITGTLAQVYPDVYQLNPQKGLNTLVFAPVQPTQPAQVAINLHQPLGVYPGLLADIVSEVRLGPPPQLIEPHNPVWTDDLAPVERVVDSMILNAVLRH